MQTEQKSELRKAYDRVDTLKLELNAEQFIELSNILCDLATNEFNRGLSRGCEISTEYLEM